MQKLTIQRAKYTIFLSMDGCFGLQAKTKESNLQDSGMITAYFIDENELDAHRKLVPESKEVRVSI